MLSDYYKSLTYLSHSVIRADGKIHEKESVALDRLCEYEKIPADVLKGFLTEIENLDFNQVYNSGLDALKKCNADEQRKVLGWIYSLVEIDKSIDIREARFLLYAINSSDHNIEEVIEISKSLPKLS